MSDLLKRLHHELLEKLKCEPDPQPPFEFQIGWGNDYNQLFEAQQNPGRFSAVDNPASLLSRALSHGRVLIHARGGSAKTVILHRLMQQQLGKDILPVWIELKRWMTSDYNEWEERKTTSERINFILQTHATPKLTMFVLGGFQAQVAKLLFVDGLNEILTKYADEILDALDEFARLIPNSGVIVSDRLGRRELRNPAAWQLATVMPIDAGELKKQLVQKFGNSEIYDAAAETTKALLASPLFLNAALSLGKAALSSSALHEAIFTERVKLTQAELECVAGAGFEAYCSSETRVFSLKQFSSRVPPEVVTKLMSENILLVMNEEGYFDHHLRHDYLAAHHIAGDRDLWNRNVFTKVTFRASSFDVLAMALEQITSSELADLFVRQVYDWNQYGAAYAVAEGRRRASVLVSKEMEVVLLAMLADRRWDLLEKTGQRVLDALNMFSTDESRAFLKAESQRDVRQLVRDYSGFSAAFVAWRDVFTRASSEAPLDRQIHEIVEEDSLVGWTSANVLKRLRLSEPQQAILRDLLKRVSPTVRWRIVHTLGAFPSEQNVNVLLESLDRDSDDWVKYGAVRSLMEMAALSDHKLRWEVLAGVKNRLDSITHVGSTLEELERAIFIDPRRSPQDWPELAIDLLNALNGRETSVERREHWSDVAYRVRERYAATA